MSECGENYFFDDINFFSTVLINLHNKAFHFFDKLSVLIKFNSKFPKPILKV